MAPAKATKAGDVYLIPATMRQPADGLGPRAQRTIAKILDGARQVFLANGYGGTTIEEIASVAEVSRTSVYTYFPSKRDVMLAAGAQAATETERMIELLGQLGNTREGLIEWVGHYMVHLDRHGSFAFAWTQAAHEDEEVYASGMKRNLKLCAGVARALAKVNGIELDDPTVVGMAISSMLERSWNYGALYRTNLETTRIQHVIGELLWAMVQGLVAADNPA